MSPSPRGRSARNARTNRESAPSPHAGDTVAMATLGIKSQGEIGARLGRSLASRESQATVDIEDQKAAWRTYPGRITIRRLLVLIAMGGVVMGNSQILSHLWPGYTVRRLPPVKRRTIKSSTTAPMIATIRLQILKPVTPEPPTRLTMNPPMNPPMMPTTMSPMMPSPEPRTIRPASQPAIPPRTSHRMIPIACFLSLHVKRKALVRRPSDGTMRTAATGRDNSQTLVHADSREPDLGREKRNCGANRTK